MNVLVNGTTLNEAMAYAERDTETGIITATVIIPQAEMEHSDLKALFKSNTEDIIYTNENGEEKIFSGFKYANMLDDDENEQYIVKLTSDENSFQIGRNRELEADKARLEATVAYREREITDLSVTITEKNKTIAEQQETIATKEVVISEKETTITEQKGTIATLENTVAELEKALSEGGAGGGITAEEIVNAVEEGVNEV